MAKSFEKGDKVIGERNGVGYMGLEKSRFKGTVVDVETKVDERGTESEVITIERDDGLREKYDTATTHDKVFKIRE